jgi:2'-5' RNA ligase
MSESVETLAVRLAANGTGRRVRAFIALPCPPDLRTALDRSHSMFTRLPGRIRWSRPDRIHLTLRFLGDSTVGQLGHLDPVLREAAAGTPPVGLRPVGTGAFPDWHRPRVVWIGFEADEALDRLQSAVEGAARDVGFESEERHFHPHLTLGRVKRNEGDRSWIETVRNWSPETGLEVVTEMVLYQSELLPEGPRYTALSRYALGEGGAP